jgi:hypothetical protein
MVERKLTQAICGVKARTEESREVVLHEQRVPLEIRDQVVQPINLQDRPLSRSINLHHPSEYAPRTKAKGRGIRRCAALFLGESGGLGLRSVSPPCVRLRLNRAPGPACVSLRSWG